MIPTFKTLDKGGVGREYKTGLSDTKKGFPPAKSEILHLITFFSNAHIIVDLVLEFQLRFSKRS